MKTKAFVLLLVGVLVLGAGLGGAFASGLALGKSQGAAAARSTPAAPPTASARDQSQTQLTEAQRTRLQQLRQQAQQGPLTPAQQQELQQLLQQVQSQFGQGLTGGIGGFAGRGGLTGTVDKIEGNTVTITTAQGPLQATLSGDTTVRKTTVGTVADLTPGLQVMVVGQRGADGTVTARSIVITPEGVNLFGGGAFAGGGQ